jgi:Protein of unknown function (DUF3293)
MPDARTLREWRRTRYAAGGAVARVGRRSPGIASVLARLGRREGAFVTAWNPLGRRMPETWNRRMARRLKARVRRLPHVAGTGQGRGWAEEHLLVAADPRRVAVLGRVFRQLGIVAVGRGRPARIVVLG